LNLSVQYTFRDGVWAEFQGEGESLLGHTLMIVRDELS